jgi:hypothetical protein
MNIAFDQASTEEEALTAFKTARKLSVKMGGRGSSEVYSRTYSIKPVISRKVFEFVNFVSHKAFKLDVLISVNCTGNSDCPETEISMKGKESNVNELVDLIDFFIENDKKPKKKPKTQSSSKSDAQKAQSSSKSDAQKAFEEKLKDLKEAMNRASKEDKEESTRNIIIFLSVLFIVIIVGVLVTITI